MEHFTAAIITISDTCAAGTATDGSGPQLKQLLQNHFQPTAIEYDLVPDEANQIEAALIYLADVLHIDLIITTGGTGFGPRDVTPEATRRVIDREAPQLALVMALFSLQKTKFAALSRSVCGMRKQSLIINMPGSRKAVAECFESIVDVLPHALQHMQHNVADIRATHQKLQKEMPASDTKDTKKSLPTTTSATIKHVRHVCPHKTNTGAAGDRNSPFEMVAVDAALSQVFGSLQKLHLPAEHRSHLDLPPFRASIKDGYAMKARSGKGVKVVMESIAAGDTIFEADFGDEFCIKINTGAPVPIHADCVIQVEDTKVHPSDPVSDQELVDILVEPQVDLDIRPIGCDLQKDEPLFTDPAYYPGNVTYESILASVGKLSNVQDPHIGVVSTGDELLAPGQELKPGKIYDSNMTMLVGLLRQFGFGRVKTIRAKDDFQSLKTALADLSAECPITICTGGVSMGDKDFVKAVVTDLGFKIGFGRVNMKPGKPMTFAANSFGRAIFGLPGNPVSAFVTFHLFVLPAIRFICNYPKNKLALPVLTVELLNDEIALDPRPEYARATITSKRGKLYAEITGDQISSRLKSIDGADVLLHLPARTDAQPSLSRGQILHASVLKQHFISEYEE